MSETFEEFCGRLATQIEALVVQTGVQGNCYLCYVCSCLEEVDSVEPEQTVANNLGTVQMEHVQELRRRIRAIEEVSEGTFGTALATEYDTRYLDNWNRNPLRVIWLRHGAPSI